MNHTPTKKRLPSSLAVHASFFGDVMSQNGPSMGATRSPTGVIHETTGMKHGLFVRVGCLTKCWQRQQKGKTLWLFVVRNDGKWGFWDLRSLLAMDEVPQAAGTRDLLIFSGKNAAFGSS